MWGELVCQERNGWSVTVKRLGCNDDCENVAVGHFPRHSHDADDERNRHHDYSGHERTASAVAVLACHNKPTDQYLEPQLLPKNRSRVSVAKICAYSPH